VAYDWTGGAKAAIYAAAFITYYKINAALHRGLDDVTKLVE
jgi:hypothetical protein